MGKAGRRQRPGSAGKSHLPRGLAFHASHTGHGSPAGRAGPGRGRPPPPPPRVRRTGTGPPTPRAPASRIGPEPPASSARSLPSRRTAAAPRHRALGARLPGPGPGRTKVTSRDGKRPAAKTEGTHKVLAPTCHPATRVQPQPSGRLILLREAGAGGGSSRSARRAVTSGLLLCALLFGSAAGSAPLSSAIFVKGRRHGSWAGNAAEGRFAVHPPGPPASVLPLSSLFSVSKALASLVVGSGQRLP